MMMARSEVTSLLAERDWLDWLTIHDVCMSLSRLRKIEEDDDRRIADGGVMTGKN